MRASELAEMQLRASENEDKSDLASWQTRMGVEEERARVWAQGGKGERREEQRRPDGRLMVE